MYMSPCPAPTAQGCMHARDGMARGSMRNRSSALQSDTSCTCEPHLRRQRDACWYWPMSSAWSLAFPESVPLAAAVAALISSSASSRASSIAKRVQ